VAWLSNYLKLRTFAQNRKLNTEGVCRTLIVMIWGILIFIATGLYNKKN
jgi:hypothetical protein